MGVAQYCNATVIVISLAPLQSQHCRTDLRRSYCARCVETRIGRIELESTQHSGLKLGLVKSWVYREDENKDAILVVEHDVEQRRVDFQRTVVAHESQFPESVHKEIDSRASCSHHFCQSLLTDFGNRQ